MTQLLFSLIVPTYARPRQLAACLSALGRLDYPREHFEVIVVDDGSPTDLRPVIAPFEQRLAVTLLTQANAGPAAARNAGAGRAGGRFLAFTDDDCAPAPGWLRALEARFDRSPDCLIGGRTHNAIAHNTYSAASQLLVDYLYRCYNWPPEQARFFTSNNFALPLAHFRQVGGFDTTFPLAAGEDREFCERWLARGQRMVYAEEALVHHHHVLSFRKFCHQQFNYGRGAFCLHHLRHAARIRQRTPLSFYWQLLTYPFAQKEVPRPVQLAALFAVSQLAVTLGFLRERLCR